MHILITNDDGILAPGIVALAEAMRTLGRVTVIAPDRNKSGVSSALSLEVPLRVTQIREDWFQLNGTPADCAKLALSGFLNEEPNILVSGINNGQNMGDDVVYSGTVGGAIEGRFLGMPSIAMSLANDKHADGPAHYETAAQVAVDLVKRLKRHPMDTDVILNVNVPNRVYDDLEGFRVTRQGDRHFSEPLKPTLDGRGKQIYWLGEPGKIKDGAPGTDFHAVQQGYVAVTPMYVDMTAHDKQNKVQQWLDKSAN